jgi:hypothetical protein
VTAQLFVDGRAAGCDLTGAVLEAAAAWDDKFVLFVSDGIPWEEGLNIHLLDAGFNVLDTITLGWAYTPGIFTGLERLPSNEFAFAFPSATRWRLGLLPRRRWQPAWPRLSPGVSRPARWWRWLELTRATD